MIKKEVNILLCLFLLLIAGCSHSNVKEMKVGDVDVKGNIRIEGTDTVYDGLMQFYDKDGYLMSAVNYEDGKINGAFIDYFRNGKIRQESQYFYGEQNGVFNIYDSLGNLIDALNLFHDIAAGPQVTYKGDSISIYKFASMDGFYLYTYTHENGQAIERGDLLTYVAHHVYGDDGKTLVLQLFIYLLDPPNRELTYKIYDKDTVTNDSTLIDELSAKKDGFFQSLIVPLPKANHKYYFRVQAYYPKQDSTVGNILKEGEMDMNMPTAPPMK